jgi:hypothetical protein
MNDTRPALFTPVPSERKQTPAHVTGRVFSPSKTPEYRSWRMMIRRCTETKKHNYDRYGGRGIKVCERWLTFGNFVADMGQRPDGTTLDRRDNDGDYEPGNCRWATTQEQNANKCMNRLVTHNGETKALFEWAKQYGLRYETLRSRLRIGWPFDIAVTMPSSRTRRNVLRSLGR